MKGEPVLLVHAQAAGIWIVQRGDRRLAVPEALGRVLARWHGERPGRGQVRGALAGAGAAPDVERLVTVLWTRPRARRRGPWLKGVLLPPPVVMRLAQPLTRVVSGRGLALATVGGLAAAATRLIPGVPEILVTWPRGAAALLLFLSTALLHELGHAAALMRRGYAPGAVGVGMLFVLPVLWCDVSAVALLSPRRRVAVDLAGPAFQLAAAGMLFLTDTLLPASWRGPCTMAGTAALAAIVWSLVPFIRSDGFWALGDLLGVGDLDRPAQAWESRRTVLMLQTYRVLHTVFLAGVGVLLARRVATVAGAVLDLAPVRQDGVALVLGAVAVLAAGLRLTVRKA
ncbi:MAG: hypothetical protein GY838_15355 [bacterium]|nr:hypothetical protein [bacterium]